MSVSNILNFQIMTLYWLLFVCPGIISFAFMDVVILVQLQLINIGHWYSEIGGLFIFYLPITISIRRPYLSVWLISPKMVYSMAGIWHLEKNYFDANFHAFKFFCIFFIGHVFDINLIWKVLNSFGKTSIKNW